MIPKPYFFKLQVKKLQTNSSYSNIYYEYKWRQPYHTTSKPNPVMYKKDYSPRSSEIYPKNIRFNIQKSITIMSYINRKRDKKTHGDFNRYRKMI